MQGPRAPFGSSKPEFTAGEKDDVLAHFVRRRAHLERQGYVFVGRGKVSPNALCPCKSGLKFKRCCTSRTVRAGGGVFVKGKLDTTGIPPQLLLPGEEG